MFSMPLSAKEMSGVLFASFVTSIDDSFHVKNKTIEMPMFLLTFEGTENLMKIK